MTSIKINSFYLKLKKDVVIIYSSDELIVIKYQKKIFCIKNFAKKKCGVGYLKAGEEVCTLYDRICYLDWCGIDEVKELFNLSDEKEEKNILSIKKSKEYLQKKIYINK